jgi:hypothetical protein
MRHIVMAVIMIMALVTSAAAEDESLQPPPILSIIPGQGSPGARVVISGTGFTAETTLYLGIEEVPAKLLSPRQLTFEIPQIASGNYALYLRQRGGETGKAYSFAVVPAKPVVTAVSPDSIAYCASGDDRRVTVRGKNFLEGARIVFDGALLKSSRITDEEMIFTVPPVPGGLHQVQVKNPEETLSGAIALLVNNRPEIRSVSQGADYVTYYVLHIEGINFQQGSQLIVNGKKIHGNYPLPGEHDGLIYKGCNSLDYQRYPYDPSAKSLELMVVNPGGEESGSFTVTAP